MLELQREKIKKTIAKSEERFEHSNLQSALMMLRRVTVGEEVEMRLDIVNVGKGKSFILKVEGLIPSNKINVKALPSYCCLRHGNLDLGKKEIVAFQVETIKLNIQIAKEGVFNLSPKIVYVDDLGETKTCELKSISITVKPNPSSAEEEKATETEHPTIEFKSEAAQKAFEFLVKSFIEDYSRP